MAKTRTRAAVGKFAKAVVAASDSLRDGERGSPGAVEDALAAVRSFAFQLEREGGPVVLAPAYASASYLAVAAIHRAGLELSVDNQADVTRLLVDAMVVAADGLTVGRLDEHRAARRSTQG